MSLSLPLFLAVPRRLLFPVNPKHLKSWRGCFWDLSTTAHLRQITPYRGPISHYTRRFSSESCRTSVSLWREKDLMAPIDREEFNGRKKNKLNENNYLWYLYPIVFLWCPHSLKSRTKLDLKLTNLIIIMKHKFAYSASVVGMHVQHNPPSVV